MKYLVVSDIHSSLPKIEEVLDFFEREQYDMLIVLGDILNYGPRNGIPEGINPQGVAKRLNQLADKIVAVRGNCDSEVDQMLLNFPIMADYALLVIDDKRIFLTHGHKYAPSNLPNLGIDLFFYGHTHLWQLQKTNKADGKGEITICNTGSITFPKNGNPATFATIDDDHKIRIRNIDGSIIQSTTF